MEDKPIFKIHYDGNGCTLICTWRTNKEPKLDIKKCQSIATQTTGRSSRTEEDTRKNPPSDLPEKPEDSPKTREVQELCDTGKNKSKASWK